MLVIVGASASGKTEIANTLVLQYHYIKSVTTTTRQKRDYEIHKIHYHFISKDAFLLLKAQEVFIETTQYQDHLYGLQKTEMDSNHIIILDPNGCNALFQLYPKDMCVVYIHSDKEIRQTRMLSRKDDLSRIQKRLDADDGVFQPSNLDKIHLTIINHHQTIASIAEEIHQYYQVFIKKN